MKEIQMYGPLKRGENEQRNEYIQRAHTRKRKHALRVTRVLRMGETEDKMTLLMR